ncbi:hypothetical protein PV328_007682 [Microctonus aethiopoides]|uniref:Uncharacterized protein n=1 Tax=Microctonus aethiopoides TaxID=144406 RepID=A0AA39C978_9HYME|nr:hypothetical protein PV328_007682 [Microctonus aethiopoides]
MENLTYFANQLKSRLRSMMSKVEELSGKKLVNNDDDDVAGNESPMSLQDVKQKEKEEKNSDTNNQEAPTTATAVTSDDEKIIYIMRLLIIFMMEGAEQIFKMGLYQHKHIQMSMYIISHDAQSSLHCNVLPSDCRMTDTLGDNAA